jgi:hypothetical protein
VLLMRMFLLINDFSKVDRWNVGTAT